jgi:hypothetical protein
MPKVIRTNYVRGPKGRILHGREVERELRDRPITRQRCRVCKGTGFFNEKIGSSVFPKECFFCDEDGYARAVCGDCGEALPMCKCVRNSGYAAAVPSG